MSSCGQTVRREAQTYSRGITGINFCLLLVLRMDRGYYQSRAVPHTCTVRVGVFLGRGENKRVGIAFFYPQPPDTLSHQLCDRYTMLRAALASLSSHHICHPKQWFLY